MIDNIDKRAILRFKEKAQSVTTRFVSHHPRCSLDASTGSNPDGDYCTCGVVRALRELSAAWNDLERLLPRNNTSATADG